MLVPVPPVAVEPEIEEPLDPSTETGSRIVDSALLTVLIYAQAVRTGGGVRPGPRLTAGGFARRRSGRWLRALQQGKQRLRFGVGLGHGGNRGLLQDLGFAQVGRLLR